MLLINRSAVVPQTSVHNSASHAHVVQVIKEAQPRQPIRSPRRPNPATTGEALRCRLFRESSAASRCPPPSSPYGCSRCDLFHLWVLPSPGLRHRSWSAHSHLRHRVPHARSVDVAVPNDGYDGRGGLLHGRQGRVHNLVAIDVHSDRSFDVTFPNDAYRSGGPRHGS